jgi:hypothetical protein
VQDLPPIPARDKASRDRLHGFEHKIGREFWRDPRTLRHNLIRAQEQAYQDGRVAEAFRRHAA